MLSILIPVFNDAIYQLTQELNEQIQAQNESIELLIADDCSSNTVIKNTNKQVCTNLPYCRFFALEENRGRTATRQFLAEQAQHDWLLFLDADVFPKHVDFIQRFLAQTQGHDLLFGGIIYRENPPDNSHLLRWTYGRERETKHVSQRTQAPYQSLISGAFMVRKSFFLIANNQHENTYGLDVLFTQNLEKIHARVHHLNNPVYHLGLEENKVFIQKTKQGIKTLVKLENEGKINSIERPIQQAYHRVIRLHIGTVFLSLIQLFQQPIERNLCSKKPSLFLFDLYKLAHFIKLKKNLKGAKHFT